MGISGCAPDHQHILTLWTSKKDQRDCTCQIGFVPGIYFLLGLSYHTLPHPDTPNTADARQGI